MTVITSCAIAQDYDNIEIPEIHSNIILDSSGRPGFITSSGDTLWQAPVNSRYTLTQMRQNPVGYEEGIRFDFRNGELNGSLHYGFINAGEGNLIHQPIFFKRVSEIKNGRAEINIKENLSGKYDFIGWQESGIVRLGYRIIDDRGGMIYDGKVILKGTGPFRVDTSIVGGPFISQLDHESALISFVTNFPSNPYIEIAGRKFYTPTARTRHEIKITGLVPDTVYPYLVHYGDNIDGYLLRTAPEPGARTSFSFAYASDSRAGKGGGERALKGTNAYILKKIGVFCHSRGIRFFQFTGDLIDGYTNSADEINLEYANWKRTMEPFWHCFPIIPGMGNHESLTMYFTHDKQSVGIDNFPFADHSSEAVFAGNFANPHNGPASEDNCRYDPNPAESDFPSYDENTFHYSYDNIGMIVLNSNYWYSYSIDDYPEISGNLHGYIMDNQLEWLARVLENYEHDENIDHVFVTLHTPILPNGGHVDDDMWYGGDNSKRPYVNGKPVDKGIIERRDELLDLLMNRSTKVVAALTGDEHNYNLLKLDENLPIYPDNWDGPRLKNYRALWLINNGSAGAPYYGPEETPWAEYVAKFSTQYAVVLFHVEGESITVEVVNPDTLEEIDRFKLK